MLETRNPVSPVQKLRVLVLAVLIEPVPLDRETPDLFVIEPRKAMEKSPVLLLDGFPDRVSVPVVRDMSAVDQHDGTQILSGVIPVV